MGENGIDLQLFQGEESWKTLFEDSELFDLKDEEKKSC